MRLRSSALLCGLRKASFEGSPLRRFPLHCKSYFRLLITRSTTGLEQAKSLHSSTRTPDPTFSRANDLEGAKLSQRASCSRTQLETLFLSVSTSLIRLHSQAEVSFPFPKRNKTHLPIHLAHSLLSAPSQPDLLPAEHTLEDRIQQLLLPNLARRPLDPRLLVRCQHERPLLWNPRLLELLQAIEPIAEISTQERHALLRFDRRRRRVWHVDQCSDPGEEVEAGKSGG